MNQESYVPLDFDKITYNHMKCSKCSNKPVYYIINIMAAMLHLCNALIFTYFYIFNNKKDLVYGITSKYTTWIKYEDSFEIITEETTVGHISIHWLIFSFHMLSFVFQMAVLLPFYNYRMRIEKQAKNPLRFIEYSFSAPLMLVSIGLLCGITDMCIIVQQFSLTVVCMVCGAICEIINNSSVKNILHITAWVAIIVAYLPIFIYFYIANSEAAENDTDGAPNFVYVIVIVQFLLFQSFGCVQLIQIYGKNVDYIRYIGYESELSYATLSLVSKTFLGWMIYSNVFLLGD